MVSRTRGEKVFNVFNLTVLGLVGLMALYPFVYTISMSLSSAADALFYLSDGLSAGAARNAPSQPAAVLGAVYHAL